MVEGVHADRTIAAGFRIRVPALPDGRCALVDAVEPRGVVALQEEGVGIIDEAVLCECLVEDGCTEEACIEFEAIALDSPMEIGTGAADGLLVGQEVVVRHGPALIAKHLACAILVLEKGLECSNVASVRSADNQGVGRVVDSLVLGQRPMQAPAPAQTQGAEDNRRCTLRP